MPLDSLDFEVPRAVGSAPKVNGHRFHAPMIGRIAVELLIHVVFRNGRQAESDDDKKGHENDHYDITLLHCARVLQRLCLNAVRSYAEDL